MPFKTRNSETGIIDLDRPILASIFEWNLFGFLGFLSFLPIFESRFGFLAMNLKKNIDLS